MDSNVKKVSERVTLLMHMDVLRLLNTSLLFKNKR